MLLYVYSCAFLVSILLLFYTNFVVRYGRTGVSRVEIGQSGKKRSTSIAFPYRHAIGQDLPDAVVVRKFFRGRQPPSGSAK